MVVPPMALAAIPVLALSSTRFPFALRAIAAFPIQVDFPVPEIQ